VISEIRRMFQRTFGHIVSIMASIQRQVTTNSCLMEFKQSQSSRNYGNVRPCPNGKYLSGLL
jgi:hypothetical protein